MIPAAAIGAATLAGALSLAACSSAGGPNNPSPAYVERVSAFFDDNGTGVRGSLWSVIKAILMDPEARQAPVDPIYGKLREPVLYLNGVLRAFQCFDCFRHFSISLSKPYPSVAQFS